MLLRTRKSLTPNPLPKVKTPISKSSSAKRRISLVGGITAPDAVSIQRVGLDKIHSVMINKKKKIASESSSTSTAVMSGGATQAAQAMFLWLEENELRWKVKDNSILEIGQGLRLVEAMNETVQVIEEAKEAKKDQKEEEDATASGIDETLILGRIPWENAPMIEAVTVEMYTREAKRLGVDKKTVSLIFGSDVTEGDQGFLPLVLLCANMLKSADGQAVFFTSASPSLVGKLKTVWTDFLDLLKSEKQKRAYAGISIESESVVVAGKELTRLTITNKSKPQSN